MKTRVIQLGPDQDHREAALEAARCLADGGLVVFPTETVYGLGACATNPAALHRLREVKQRTETKPFTLHIGSRSQVRHFVPEISGVGQRLVEKAWPGPLTLIFSVPRPEEAPAIRESSPEHIPAMYHEGTIGIRCPDDRVAADVLTGAGVPVVAASANPAGAPAPVDAEEALATLDGIVDLVLDAGRSRYSKPSTIVRVNHEGYQFIRDGVLDERTIRRLAQVTFLLVCSGNTCRSPMAAGVLKSLLAEKLGCRPEDLPAKGYYVESAGVSAYPGAYPSPPAEEVLKEKGIDISSHRSQPLTLELANRADYIFTMTRHHLDALTAFGPSVRQRARTLDDEDIEDPIGENRAVYAQCADRLEKALRRRLEEIPL